MKKALFIYNPNSGKKTKKKIKVVANFNKIKNIFNEYNYEVEFMETNYAGHAKEIVATANYFDLVVSLGGDGTFNEVVTGNLKRKNYLVMAHIPYGTTNDIGTMFGLNKNIYNNLELLLSGKEKNVDIGLINDRPFVYVAGFGKFLNVPYETSRKMKKKVGYFAYLINAIKDFLFNKTPLYELEYEIDGEKYHGLYSFALISNANRIAGINNFYKNVKLDDNELEILFCNLKNKQEVIRSLFYSKTTDITKISGIYFHKCSSLKIKFIDKLKKPWCLDGEKLDYISDEYNIKITNELKMLVPSKVIDKLFTGDNK